MSVSEYWTELSSVYLRDDELALFRTNLDWVVVSKYGKLSNEAWITYQDHLHYPSFSINPSVPFSVVEELKAYVLWHYLSRNRPIREEETFSFMKIEQFSTFTFFTRNLTAHRVSPETISQILDHNDAIFRSLSSQSERKGFIRDQVVRSMLLEPFSDSWTKTDWAYIAQGHALSERFIERFRENLDDFYLEDNLLAAK